MTCEKCDGTGIAFPIADGDDIPCVCTQEQPRESSRDWQMEYEFDLGKAKTDALAEREKRS